MDALTAAWNVAHDYRSDAGSGAKQLGIDIDHPALTNEVNKLGTAKLGLLTAIKMTKRTGDLRILNAFAAECDCMVLPLPAALLAEGSETMFTLGQTAKEFADVVKEVGARAADNDISDNDLDAIELEWGQLVAAGQKMLATLRAQNQARKPNLRSVGRP